MIPFLAYTAVLVVAILIVQAERRRRARELRVELRPKFTLPEDPRVTEARAEATRYLAAHNLTPRYTDQSRFLEAGLQAEVDKTAFYRDIAARAAMRRGKLSSDRIN